MKKKVAFICVHNSCRSQMAEALGKLYGDEVFESYSAGTETKPQINQDAVRIIKNLYNVDMNETQKSKWDVMLYVLLFLLLMLMIGD